MKNWLPGLLLLVCLPVMADEPTHYDRVQLSASATGTVNNDTMTATLSTQDEGQNTARLANEVNERIQWAVREVRKHAGLKVRTQAYNTQPIYNKNVITGWRVSQSIQIKSHDAALLSDMLGTLQERLNLTGISFSVSPELRESSENSLISEAIAAFKQRAKIIAQDLGHSSHRLVSMNVSTSGGQPYYESRGMMMEAMPAPVAMAAPVVEAGESQLSVSVSGEIELR
jgi:predicted secreted protein